MHRKIKGMKLRYKLSIFILPLLALFFLLYIYISNFIENEMLFRLTEHNRHLNHWNVTYTQNILSEMKNACDATLHLDSPTRLSEIEQVVTNLSSNRNVHGIFPNIANFWRVMLSNSSYIRTVAITSYDGPTVYMTNYMSPFFINTGLKFTDPNLYWMQNAISKRGGHYVSSEDNQLRLSREIICPTRLVRLGVITVEADIPFAAERFESVRLFANQHYGLLVNGQLSAGNADFNIEEVLTAINTPSPFDSIVFDRSNNAIMVYYRQESPVEIISFTIIPYNAMFMQVFQGIGGFVLVTFLGITGIGLALFFAVVMRSTIKSLKIFEGAFSQIEQGEFGQLIDVEVEGELQDLLNSYNQMSRKLAELITEVYERKLTEQKLELEMLRDQINPHFLYNTLETLRMNSLIGAEKENVQIIEYLGTILRYGVSSGAEPATVEEELKHLEYYVNLHNLRFDSRVYLKMFIQPELMKNAIIRLLLQPIVENAIKHGMRPSGAPLEIRITGYVKENRVIYTITDNGKGITKEKTQEIMAVLKDHSAATGIGIYNVNRRIRLMYGESYGLTIYPLSDRGTEVRIELPYIKTQYIDKEETAIWHRQYIS